MTRRGFFRNLSLAVGGVALAEAIPFNRVWSFPSEIIIPRFETGGVIDGYSHLAFPLRDCACVLSLEKMRLLVGVDPAVKDKYITLHHVISVKDDGTILKQLQSETFVRKIAEMARKHAR